MITDNISGKKGTFSFLNFFYFLFIVCVNLIGLVRYSFTLTSHLIVTFALGIIYLIGINIICIGIHGSDFFFHYFFPAGTSLMLAFLLVPIEIISLCF